jgi:hypothetical protein
MLLTKTFFASEISFYQNHLEQLLRLQSIESNQRLFSVARYDAVTEVEVEDYFASEFEETR